MAPAELSALLLCGLRPLGAVLGSALFTVGNTLRVERTANDVIANAGEILDAAASDHHDAVLLQVVTDSRNISRNLVAVREPNTGNLSQSGVGLFGC